MAKLIQVIVTDVPRGRGLSEDDPCRLVTQYFTTDGELLAEVDTRPEHQVELEKAHHRAEELLAHIAEERRKRDRVDKQLDEALTVGEKWRASHDQVRKELDSTNEQLAAAVGALTEAGFAYTRGAEKPWRPPVNLHATALYRLLDQLEQWRTETNRIDTFGPLWKAVGAARQTITTSGTQLVRLEQQAPTNGGG